MTSAVIDLGLLDPAVERRVTALGVAVTAWEDGDVHAPATNRGACPCIYLVATDAPAPRTWGRLTDWVRLPVLPDELLARAEALAARADAWGRPGIVVDRDDVVHVGGRSIPLSELQARLLRALLEQAGVVVSRQALVDVTWPDGAPADPRAIDNRVKLLRRRLGGTSVAVHAIRGRGFVLQHASCPSAVDRAG